MTTTNDNIKGTENKSKIISDRLYSKRLKELACIYLVVVTCKICGSPRNKGYICPFCEKDDSEL